MTSSDRSELSNECMTDEDDPDLPLPPMQQYSQDGTAISTGTESNLVTVTGSQEYVAWIGDFARPGLLPRTLWSVSSAMILLCFFIIVILLPTVVPTQPAGSSLSTIILRMSFVLNFTLMWFALLFIVTVFVINGSVVWHEVRWRVLYISCLLYAFWAGMYYIMTFGMDSDIIPNRPSDPDLSGGLLPWVTGKEPLSMSGCTARVTLQQKPLFSPGIYQKQFGRTYIIGSDGVWQGKHVYQYFNISAFQEIHADPVLCGIGFSGDADLYGNGTRAGIYLVWLSSLLANNLLPQTRQGVQKAYLAYTVVFCIETVIQNFRKACVFSVETEILYWYFWGGLVCVYASAPNPLKYGTAYTWIQLDWSSTILFITSWVMAYHGVWFAMHGYDQVYSRMPCGTYHFFLAALMDPSSTFFYVRDLLTFTLVPVVPMVILGFPLVAVLMIPEIKDAATRILSTVKHDSSNGMISTNLNPTGAGLVGSSRATYIKARTIYYRFREYLIGQRRGGIRLITPVHVEDRRSLRIRLIALGTLALMLSIAAIETILSKNKIVGVELQYLSATGQHISLIFGLCSILKVFWDIYKQEIERRRRLKISQEIPEEGHGIELQTLSNPVGYAFAQPDDEFRMSGGLGTAEEGEEAADPGPSTALPGGQVQPRGAPLDSRNTS